MGSNQPTAAIYNGNFQGKHWVVVGENSSRDDISHYPLLVKLAGSDVIAEEQIIKLQPGNTFSSHQETYGLRASSLSHNLVTIFSAEHLNEKY